MGDAGALLWHSERMANTLNILIIEDDPSINEVVAAHLERAGHRCAQAFSGSEGLLLFEGRTAAGRSFDLVITDLMLPGAAGEDVVAALRDAAPDLPIIVISARITAADKVTLLKLGADDYLTKPFDLDELSARIDVQMRHRALHAASGDTAQGIAAGASSDTATGAPAPEPVSAAPPEEPLRFREWALYPEARAFTVAGEPLSLTRTEFNILALLMGRPSKVFTKQELFELAWDEPYSVEDSTVNVHVSHLRRKLKPSGTDAYLQTVWGLGFKLAAF